MKKIILLGLIFNVLWACQPSECPEQQTNAILRQNSVDSPEYQHELARLIRSETGNVQYYFEERTRHNGNDYLLVNCHGRRFCGTLKVLVQAEDAFSQKLQNQKGWHGARLKGFTLSDVEHQGSQVLAYAGMRGIRD